MKLPTREQEDAVITADYILTFIVKCDWKDTVVKEMIYDRVMQYYSQLDKTEQAEALFLEAALIYIKGI